MKKTIADVYLHEDDYCQQEILPAAALSFCRRQLNEIDDFSVDHQAPGGVGWTDMLVREDSRVKLGDLDITRTSFNEIMKEKLGEIPAIYTGYSSYRELCRQTVGFGLHSNCIIYANWNEQEIVENIWTGIFTTDKSELLAAVSALQSLGKQYPLLYVDWAWGFVTLLDQSSVLLDTLAAKAAEIAERSNGK